MPESTGTLSAARAWCLHLAAYIVPLLSLAFLLTGPHAWWSALLWCLPVFILTWIDNRAPAERRTLAPGAPVWPFNLQLYGLAALQLANYVLLGVMVSRLGFSSWPEVGATVANFVAMHFVSGVAAAYSGIVVAHELVHRHDRLERFVGRLLLMFVFYDHFAIEHVRGHHNRVATGQDPATARFGETFNQYFARSVPAQFRSAWRLEKARLRAPDMGWLDRRMLRNRMLHGLAGEAIILAGFGIAFGWMGVVALVLQARMAVTLLEVVNYIEHWGLARRGRIELEDSWDTDNRFTLYTLLALSRHADHHTRYSTQFQGSRPVGQSPKMPLGYYGTITLAALRNRRYRELAAAELRARGLGPFRDEPAAQGALSGGA